MLGQPEPIKNRSAQRRAAEVDEVVRMRFECSDGVRNDEIVLDLASRDTEVLTMRRASSGLSSYLSYAPVALRPAGGVQLLADLAVTE